MHTHQALEVLDRLDTKLQRGLLVADEQRARVHLEGGHRPHVVDTFLDRLGQSERLVGAGDEDDHLFTGEKWTLRNLFQVVRLSLPYLSGVHDGAHAHGECLLWHLAVVVAEEASIRIDRVHRQRLQSGARGKARAGLVEGNVPVGTDAADEQLDATGLLDLRLVRGALRLQVWCIAIEDVRILRIDVDVTEKVLIHKRMITFGVLARQSNVFVHVEGDHVLERHRALPGVQQEHRVSGSDLELGMLLLTCRTRSTS